MPRKKLTFKQDKFVKEYIKCEGNASEAVRKAYPNIKSKGAIRTMASKLVTNGNVQRKIQEILDEEGLTSELVVRELKKMIEDDDKSEKNKAIRTACEIMGLIGKGGLIATQVNIGQEPIFADLVREKAQNIYEKRIQQIEREKK